MGQSDCAVAGVFITGTTKKGERVSPARRGVLDMRRIFFAVLLVACGVGAAAAQGRRAEGAPAAKSVAETLISRERSSWEAVKRKDYKTFESFLAEDFYDIFASGKAVTKAELMRDYIRSVDLLDYSLSNFKVVMLNREAAIVVYEAVAHGVERQLTSRGTEPGAPAAIHAAVTSGWARRGGRWRNVFYRENDIK